MKSCIVLAVLSLVVAAEGFGLGPLHASCKVQWTFALQCTNVSAAIVKQIGDWKGDAGCGSGEKCLYELVSNTNTEVKATHSTPVKHYVDDLTFTLTQATNTCNVAGYSRSETWYAVLDYGTNYCNLHNLIVGAGLDKSQGYTETTSDSICTQFTSANCDKY